jgi:hypothetical protein
VRRLAAILLTAAAAVVPASSAQAGVLVESATSCSSETLSQPFARWLDPARYTLVPGGAFEAGQPAWSVAGGASVVSGNETYFVHGAADSRSLRLPAGASATSPAMCVGLGEPTLRFFGKLSGGGLLSSLRVEALVEDQLGLVKSVPLIVLGGGGASWSPTLPSLVVANLLPLLPGATTPVAFRFTPVGAGTWSVDDVYVDPWSSR